MGVDDLVPILTALKFGDDDPAIPEASEMIRHI